MTKPDNLIKNLLVRLVNPAPVWRLLTNNLRKHNSVTRQTGKVVRFWRGKMKLLFLELCNLKNFNSVASNSTLIVFGAVLPLKHIGTVILAAKYKQSICGKS